MQDIDLYIVAAGNGSRLQSNVPKALISILDEPCLTTTLRMIADKFRRVFVITSIQMQENWLAYLAELRRYHPLVEKQILHLPIHSGLGDGHATLHGLLAAERAAQVSLAEDAVIMWGDVFLPSGDLMQELLTRPLEGAGLVPAVKEANPYVCLLVNNQMQCVAADFSKYGETHLTGLHDQSVFRFRRTKLRDCLQHLHYCLWKHDRYVTPAGELSLLYAFHNMYNMGDAVYVYETVERARSFNTPAEVDSIRREMRVLRGGAGRKNV